MIYLRQVQNIEDKIDGSSLTAALSNSSDLQSIQTIQLPFVFRRGSIRLGDLFEVEMIDTDGTIVIEGDCRSIDRLGERFEKGKLIVNGSVGDQLGNEMRGGAIEVNGSAGSYLCCGMKRGQVVVHGDAGDFVAAPVIGGRRGMSGGGCIVVGSVGARVAERMRRGVLVIGGDAGDSGGSNMIAGTIVVLGKIGDSWCEGMRRGSIVLMGDQVKRDVTESLSGRFSPWQRFDLNFLRLLWRHLRMWGPSEVAFPDTGLVWRTNGDLSRSGMGEVLLVDR